MRKCLLRAMLVTMFMVIVAFAWGQSIFYEEPFDTNQGWTLESNWSIASGALTLGWSPSQTNYDLSATSPNIVVPATAGDMVISQYLNHFSSVGNPVETFEIIAVAGGTDNILWSYDTNSDWGSTGGQDLTLSLAPYAGQTIQLKFRSHGESTFNFNYWYIYDIKAYASLDNDLAATEISGPTTPNIGTTVPYVVTVRNAGLTTTSNYTVKLMQTGDVELGSLAGTSIAPQEYIDYTFDWTPTVLGETELWGKVVFAADENPSNDETAHLTVSVMESGLLVAEIGTGTQTNTSTGSPTPYGTWYKAFRQQFLYTADDFLTAGAAPGMISALAFNVQSLDACTPMNNYRIRLKHTDQAALSSTFETGDYTTVWQRDTFMPALDWNVHNLDTPFMWDGASNLIVEIVTDMVVSYDRNALVYYSTTDYVSSVRYESDSNHGLTGTTGSTSSNRSNIRFFMMIEGMGSLSGTVTADGSPLPGAEVSVDNTVFTALTGADGGYSIPFVPEGVQTVSATKHGYNVVSHNVTIVEDEASTQDFVLTLLPQVTVSGRIVGSDAPTVGLAGATIALSGYEPYEATTDASGQFTIPNVFASQTYGYLATMPGYSGASGTVEVGTTNVNMGDIVVSEIALPPFNVVATEAANYQSVDVTWEAPNPDAISITEGFEGDVFPPEDWSQIINCTGAGAAGVLATWCQFGTATLDPPVPPYSGDYQAGLWWDWDHQDEWLITPEFICPGNGSLSFWSYVFQGSTEGDHYYVKVSTDDGDSWTVIWDASTLTGGWNYYENMISVDLSSYAGQQIKLAFNAEDPPSNDGLWYVWFIDDVDISGPSQRITFSSDQLSTRKARAPMARGSDELRPISRDPNHVYTAPQTRTVDRALTGYKVYRLLADDQANEANWTTLTTNTITPTEYTDSSWGPLPSGVYKYAVKAVYTNDVMSPAAFSAELHKGMMGTLAGTVTEFGTDLPIEGATITAGDYSGTSDATGAYEFAVYDGTYEVTAAKTGYQSSTEASVVITGLETTTVNFVLTEITLPPGAVTAEEAGANVNVTWMAPGTAGGEWIDYATSESSNSIGTGGVADFDVAIRFPPSALTEYAGMSLHAVNVWPAQAGTFSLRVWTGGSASAPGPMVVDQAFTPQLDVYNTVVLDNPVLITGDEELWFGYRCNVTGGYPAGCDDGPAVEGFGNMMYFQNEWDTLNNLGTGLNYNWCIQGYVGYGAPDRELIALDTKISAEQRNAERAMEGYKVWRLLQGQESNEAQWTGLTPDAISATAFQDTGWGDTPDGIYKWAVKAVYTGGALSNSAFSNAIERLTEIGTVAGFVRDEDNQPITGATVATGNYSATTNNNGAYSMAVPAGTHTLVASHPNYAAASQAGVIVVTGETTTVNFQLQPTQVLLEDGFETYPDFATTFAPWTLVDVDQSATYGFSEIDFPGTYDPMAYIIFNPSQTTPPMDDNAPHGGDKMAACFAATTPPNNDWMITPQLDGGGQISFWAKTYMDYGLERFNIGVSTTGTSPADFTIISGDSYVEVPLDWTEFTYDLGAYAGQEIYIGIQCVSSDCFIFLVDDVTVMGPGESSPDDVVPVHVTKLGGNYPNPFNPVTTIPYSVKEATDVTIEIFNVRGQLVKRLVSETKAAGEHTAVWNGIDNNGRAVSSGIYYFKMNAGKYSSTKKMIMMK